MEGEVVIDIQIYKNLDTDKRLEGGSGVWAGKLESWQWEVQGEMLMT